jgi:dihydrofolate reductase
MVLTLTQKELGMTTAATRRFIAAMQVTLDGYSPGGAEADWVDSWADGLDLLPRVDAFVLGGGMFPEYEMFWAAVRDDPATAAEWLGREVYPREIEYARVAAGTPHLVLSTKIRDAAWPTARIVRDLDELRAFKSQPGGPVYVVGGAGLVRSLIDEGLIDELRLIVHPVVLGAGSGPGLLGGIAQRRDLELVGSERTPTGRVHLTYHVPAPETSHAH